MGFRTVLLGLTFGDPLLPSGHSPLPTYNPAGLLHYLETFYGLGAPTVNRSALRTEQYRQLIALHLERAPRPPFYAATFEADPFATSEELLSRRDELLAAGWKLTADEDPPPPERLLVLRELEQLLLADTNELDLLPGTADRLTALLAALSEDRHPRLHILVNEPIHLLPAGTRRLLAALQARGDRVEQLPEPALPDPDSDLSRWQRALRHPPAEKDGKPELQGDGSLILLRAPRETYLADYLARSLRDNPDWRPGVLMSVRNQTLDNAIVMEGLPSMGIPSDSLARPSLQVLKLVTAFLWEPMEVERIMEFVSLVSKPLHWRLANRIARFLASTPGMFGPRWYRMIGGFFEEMRQERQWSAKKIRDVRDEYDNWFERKRYGRTESVPKAQLRFLFLQLREWALDERTDRRKRDQQAGRPLGEYGGLLVLYTQAQRAVELLDAQPEQALNYLAVERLVRTVYEPAPAQFSPRQQGSLCPFFSPASAIVPPGGEAPERLLWWDFIEQETDYFFSRYYRPELDYLDRHGVRINGPAEKNALSLWQQRRPVLLARRQLVLCLPERVDGAEVEAHPLFGDLQAAFAEGSLPAITIEVDLTGSATGLSAMGAPDFAIVPLLPLDAPTPHLDIRRLSQLDKREKESPTSMENLLFYPHKYVFRQALNLRGTPVLSIASEARLRGNLAHLFIEQLLTAIDNDPDRMTKEAVEAWFDEHNERLFRTQGAVLLQYGQEPERIQFVRTMKKAAWALVFAIRENGWRVRGCEESLNGKLDVAEQGLTGRADLVLTRERHGISEAAVVDLKWQGKTAFENLLRNNRDVQLALYGDLVRKNLTSNEDGERKHAQPDRVHTAYFLIRFGRLLGRDQVAFRQTNVHGDEEAGAVYEDMLRRVRNTYAWRREQFRIGTLEIRCEATAPSLDDAYQGTDWDDLFEMETADPPFDDYRSLIGLVR